MTIHIKNGSLDTTISRRGFVAGVAGSDFRFHARRAWASVERRLAPHQATQIQCLGQHRRRQHHHHPLSGGRNGAGRADLIAADPGRGTRRRLVEGEDAQFAPPNPKVYGNPHDCSTVRRSQRRACRCPAISCRCAWPARRPARFCSMPSRRNGRCRSANSSTENEHGRSPEIRPTHQLWRCRRSSRTCRPIRRRSPKPN